MLVRWDKVRHIGLPVIVELKSLSSGISAGVSRGIFLWSEEVLSGQKVECCNSFCMGFPHEKVMRVRDRREFIYCLTK